MLYRLFSILEHPDRITVEAPAKLNLFLEVGPRLPNGYHEVDTVMCTVSMTDRLIIEKRAGTGVTVELSCDIPTLATSDNLCCRAAHLFFEAADITDVHLHITLRKRIPVAAGLAGGSADAAAVLRALNNLYRPFGGSGPLDSAALTAIAAKLGADVPFCLFGGLCHATGIGQDLMDLPIPQTLQDMYIVILSPDAHKLSTAEMYGAIDTARKEESPHLQSSAALTAAIRQGTLPATALFNRFEEVMIPRFPAVAEAKALLLSHGADAALMSGSGPTVYGLFSDPAAAEKAALALDAIGHPTFVARPCGRY